MGDEQGEKSAESAFDPNKINGLRFVSGLYLGAASMSCWIDPEMLLSALTKAFGARIGQRIADSLFSRSSIKQSKKIQKTENSCEIRLLKEKIEKLEIQLAERDKKLSQYYRLVQNFMPLLAEGRSRFIEHSRPGVNYLEDER